MDRAKRRKMGKQVKFTGISPNRSWKYEKFESLEKQNEIIDECKKYICCSVIIAYSENNVLLCKYKQKKEWTSPGGGTRRDENVLQSGWREFQEETKGILRIQGDISKYPGIVGFGTNRIHHLAMIVFFVKIVEEVSNNLFLEKIKNDKDPEITEIKWVSLDEFMNFVNLKTKDDTGYVMYENLRKFLEGSNMNLKSFFNFG
jgi:ADP-ribose pyrophosphatase YjhB (NUDIX family)